MDTRFLMIPLVVAAFGLPAHTLGSKDQPAAQELPPSHSARPASPPRWVFFDFDSGIKTIELADGSIHEELFERERATQSTVPPAEAGLFDPVATGSLQTHK